MIINQTQMIIINQSHINDTSIIKFSTGFTGRIAFVALSPPVIARRPPGPARNRPPPVRRGCIATDSASIYIYILVEETCRIQWTRVAGRRIGHDTPTV